jgi:hypothetical protein
MNGSEPLDFFLEPAFDVLEPAFDFLELALIRLDTVREIFYDQGAPGLRRPG